MGSWATVASLEAPVQKAAQATLIEKSAKKTAVVDTNAIVAGLQLHTLAERAVTVSEVLKEVRDARSRQFLATLPFGIECLEPAFESLAAGKRTFLAQI